MPAIKLMLTKVLGLVSPQLARQLVLQRLAAVLLTSFPLFRFLFISLPLGFIVDFCFRGVSRHFIALRNAIPEVYRGVFQIYALNFIQAFGIQAATAFQTFTRVLAVGIHSVFASLVFIAAKHVSALIALVKYPFALLGFYYLDLWPHFCEALAHFAPSWAAYAASSWTIIWGFIYLLVTFMMVRFVFTTLSVLNQLRLVFSSISSAIHAAIISNMTSPTPVATKTSKKS